MYLQWRRSLIWRKISRSESGSMESLPTMQIIICFGGITSTTFISQHRFLRTPLWLRLNGIVLQMTFIWMDIRIMQMRSTLPILHRNTPSVRHEISSWLIRKTRYIWKKSSMNCVIIPSIWISGLWFHMGLHSTLLVRKYTSTFWMSCFMDTRLPMGSIRVTSWLLRIRLIQMEIIRLLLDLSFITLSWKFQTMETMTIVVSVCLWMVGCVQTDNSI